MQKIIKGFFKEFDFLYHFVSLSLCVKEGKKMLKKVLLTKQNEYFCLGMKTQLKIK